MTLNRFLLPLNLQLFSADPGAPAGGGEPIQDPTPGGSGNPDQTPTPEPKTFTQEQLDTIVADRIARERKKYSNHDELQAKIAQYEKEQEEKRLEGLAEVDRLKELLAKAEETTTLTNKELENVRTQLKQDKIVSEFVKQATAKNIAYTDAALKLADLSNVEITDEGIVGISEIVDKLVEANPFLLKEPVAPKIIGESNSPSPKSTDKTSDQLLREAAEKARISGKPEDKVAYATLKRELGL